MKKLVVVWLIVALIARAAGNCPELPEQLVSEITCTNGTKVESKCQFECKPGYSLIPERDDPSEYVLNCQKDENWDKEVPFCDLSCPSNAKADIIFVVDLSTSMRGVNRHLLRDVLVHMIGLWKVSSDNVNVAVVPYSSGVLTEYVIFLNSFSNDKKGLIDAVNQLPENESGSFTGKALSFALDMVLAATNGNRSDAPDIVLVMTDGRGQDNVSISLERLWNAGVTTYSFGFHPRRKKLLTRQLFKIARNDSSHVHLTERNGTGDTADVMRSMRGVYCPPTAICNPFAFHYFKNGTMNCDSVETNIGATCRFECNEGFSLVGSDSMTCLADGPRATWSNEAPTCVEIDACKPPRDTIEKGKVACTNFNRVGSVCKYSCTALGHKLFPPSQSTSACLSNSRWSQRKPCCALPCPPHAKMDAAIVLDSSSSIGAENWIIMTDFVRDILRRFTISDEATNFAVVRYNKEVDTESQILLRDFPNDKEGLIAAFNRISYDGSGTFTGAALQHVLDNILTVEAGNRREYADLLIVITDGKAKDDVRTPSNRLRETGATILVIGIVPNNGGLNLFQLRDIAGSDDNLFIVEAGFEDLDKNFARQITDKACGDPCAA